ncbi:MAG: hypothetical protein PHQ00_06065 [Phycisphaerae bacterium]|nr:hypothetical protein [Phycisphaerae bacterium]
MTKFLINNFMLALTISIALSASAQAPTPFKAVSASPTAVSFPIPRFKYLDDKFYSESFSFVGDLDDGGFLQVQFAVTNFGFSGSKGSIRIVYVSRGGALTREIIEVGSEEQRAINGGVEFGGNSLVLEGGQYKITAKGERIEVNVGYIPYSPAFRPGNGRIYFGSEKKFYDITVLFLSARLTGEISIAGEKIALKGFATANNSYGNQAPQKQAKRWFRYMKVRGDNPALFTIIYPEEGEPIGWFISADGNALGGFSLLPRLLYSGSRKAPDSAFGYEIPDKVMLKLDDNEAIKIVAESPSVFFKQDVISDLGYILGMLAKQFIQPESYTLRYSGKMHYNGETISAPALVEITFITK